MMVSCSVALSRIASAVLAANLLCNFCNPDSTILFINFLEISASKSLRYDGLRSEGCFGLPLVTVEIGTVLAEGELHGGV
jgi:hypothetical protein